MNYKSALNNKIFEVISRASQELNIESYVIGGFVRDYLLGREFKKDIDVVAIGSGIEIEWVSSDANDGESGIVSISIESNNDIVVID